MDQVGGCFKGPGQRTRYRGKNREFDLGCVELSDL